MSNQVIYTVKGTKVENLDFLENPFLEFSATPITKENTQTVKYWSKDNPKTIHTVDVKFLEPSIKVNVSPSSYTYPTYKDFDNGEIAKKLAELHKANPGKKFMANIIALSDLTKGNGKVHFTNFDPAAEDISMDVHVVAKETNGKTIDQIETTLLMSTQPPSYKASDKIGSKDHLIYQYAIYRNDGDGVFHGYEHVSQPLVVEMKTVGSLSGQ